MIAIQTVQFIQSTKGKLSTSKSSTISDVLVTGHFYNSYYQLVGDTNSYTDPPDLEPQHTGTFDVLTNQINGLPTFVRLSYDWD